MVGERFPHQANRACIEILERPAVLAPHAVARQAGGTQVRDEFAATGVDRVAAFVARMSGKMGSRPGIRLAGERAVSRIEERQQQEPFVKLRACAHRPMNSGLPRAAKAWKARLKSSVCMQIACACASASRHWSRLMLHSWLSMFLVMACAKPGPLAHCAASAWASDLSCAQSTRR